MPSVTGSGREPSSPTESRNTLAEHEAKLDGLLESMGVDTSDEARAEQSRHIARREEIMQARGERRQAGRHPNPLTVSGFKTTSQLAEEAGMSERTYQQRAKKAIRVIKITSGESGEAKHVL